MSQEVWITEFMPRNNTTLLDIDQAFSDWIEIHNPSSEAVNLEGWALSDELGNPQKWLFPPATLSPESFMIVFASGKDYRNPQSELHTDFKLSASGEYLSLANPAGTLVQSFSPSYPPLAGDQSYGLNTSPDRTIDLTIHGFLSLPSPRRSNGIDVVTVTGKPEFSHPSHTFTESFELSINNPSAAGAIRYSIGSSEPNQDSLVYSGPIRITRSTQIRARLFETGKQPGPIETVFFTKLQPDAIAFSSNLPVVLVDTFARRVINEGRQTAAGMLLFEPDQTGRTHLTSRPTAASRAALRVRGSSSTGRPKKSYAVELWESGTNEDRDLELLGMPADSDWILYGPYNFDRAMIRNPFVYAISRQMGRYSVRTRFVEMFLNDDGDNLEAANFGAASDYQGVYVLMEKLKRGEDRIEVEPLPVTATSEPEIQGGYILKIDRPDPGDIGFNAGGQRFLFVEPKEDEINNHQSAWIRRYMNRLDTAVKRGNPRNTSTGYRAYLDVPSWIDHHFINEFTKNPDGFRLSGYMFKKRYGKLEGGPVWDFDRTLGPDDDGRASDPSGWSNYRYFGWFQYLFRDPEWELEYADRYFELRQTVFDEANLIRVLDELANPLEEAQVRNYTRWSGLLSPNGNAWKREVGQLRGWVQRRLRWMDTQFPKPPDLSHPGGPLETSINLAMTPAFGTVYYRLDGEDPRAVGGGIRPGTKALRSPESTISITKTTQLLARSFDRDRDHWSAKAEAIFTSPEPAPLQITEIMYNPAPSSEQTFSARDYEFIELRNTGTEAINTIGTSLREGVYLDLPNFDLLPGETVILAKNPKAFAERYPMVKAAVFGPYEGTLNNAGETILLKDLSDRTLSRVTYDDQAPWPSAADGEGHSLELVVTTASESPESWRSSLERHGSPGVDNLLSPQTIKITAIEVSGETFVIRFNATVGSSFQLQSRDENPGTVWKERNVSPQPLGPTSWEFRDPVIEGTRLYRISDIGTRF